MTQLLHQLGHRYQWSLSSIMEDNTGDGAILGPRYMEPAKLNGISESLRKTSLFDPQFFLPNTVVGKLKDYSFFPSVLSGSFSTTDWSVSSASDCAKRCIEFQSTNGFGGIIIPTRFYEGMPSNFTTNQESQFVCPFLNSIDSLNVKKPVYLQLILTDQMLKDKAYTTQILNWITSFPKLSGIYLIIYVHNRAKQIADVDLLIGILNFIRALKIAGMAVVVGYTNTESVLLLCADPDAVTMGAYENLRMFSLRAFENQENDNRGHGPNARIYIPRLFDWIEHQYIGAISRVVENIDDYIGNDSYRMQMFEPTYNWHFAKSEPYKHYFKAFTAQFRQFARLTGTPLVDKVLTECQNAYNEFDRLRKSGIILPSGNAGEHIAAWITAINLWRQEVGL